MESGAPPMLDCGWNVVVKLRDGVRKDEVRAFGRVVDRLRNGIVEAIFSICDFGMWEAGRRCAK